MIFSNIHKVYSDYFQTTRSNIYLFCPFIKVNTLKKINSTQQKLSIITTWRIIDLLEGYSDLELYSYCKSIGAYLYLNQRIHLKVLTDLNSAIIGSANITEKGIGLSNEPNHECVTRCDKMNLHHQVYLNRILQESTLMNDRLFENFKNTIAAESAKNVARPKIPDINLLETINKEFLISSLPMSRNIDQFYEYYAGQKSKVSNEDEDYDCAAHDIALYGLPEGLNRQGFMNVLKNSFFDQPFIKALKRFICEPRYFGSIKEWVQNNCTNVPIPSRRELTGNVQVLYEWFAELGKDEFITDRPNHSQRIYPINAKTNESSIR